MMNVLTESDMAKLGMVQKPVETSTVQGSSVPPTTIVRRPAVAATHLFKEDGKWGWDELRDYVVIQIEARIGPFPRDGAKEASMFKRFLKQWGDEAPLIARYAFEVLDGRWVGAPIRIERFSKGCDDFFAAPISEQIRSAAA